MAKTRLLCWLLLLSGSLLASPPRVITLSPHLTELAFAAGANVVTVLGCASDEVIERVVRSARRYEGTVMADSLSVPNIPERAKQLRDLGVNSLCINRRGLKKHKGSPEEGFKRFLGLIPEIELPIYLAGGIDLAELTDLSEAPLAGVIIGAAIAEASSPANAARQMRRLLDQRQDPKNKR